MARPIGEATKRGNVRKSFEKALTNNNMENAVYQSRYEQYMAFYDRKTYANGRLNNIETGENPDDTSWIKISGEVRQLDRQMMEIEKYFGFKPSEDSGETYTTL